MLYEWFVSAATAVQGTVVVVVVIVVVELDVVAVVEVDVVVEMLVVSTICDCMLVLFNWSVVPVVTVFSIFTVVICLIVVVKAVAFESMIISDILMVVSSAKLT